VLHSGIYYAHNSRKAFHCLRGNRWLREFCRRYNVPWRDTGKFVVAQDASQLAALEQLLQRGQHNDVPGLEIVDQAAVSRREPHIRAHAALWVPSAAIVNAESLIKTLLRLAQDRGAAFAPQTRLLAVETRRDRLHLHTSTGDFETDLLVNAAGLYADEVARMCGEERYTVYPVRGEYCHVHRRHLDWLRGLVYPLPTPLSLGIHLTRTVEDALLLGPTARYILSKEDYEQALLPPEFFLAEGRHLLPDLQLDDLTLAYTGIRPKLIPEHGTHDHSSSPVPSGDFIVERDLRHRSVIHLLGIESPGLTACTSLAREVVELVVET